jgi:hypothetical protein
VLHVVYLVFKRGILSLVGRFAHPSRPLRRGHPAGASAGRAAPRARGAGTARADVAPRTPAANPAHLPRRSWCCWRHQDRGSWDRTQIAEGCALVERGPRLAGLRSLHPSGRHRRGARRVAGSRHHRTGGRSSASTTCCFRADPSPVIALNRAAAVAMRGRAGSRLMLIDEILAQGELDDYHLAHSARADLCRRWEGLRRRSRPIGAPRPDPAHPRAAFSGGSESGSSPAMRGETITGQTSGTRAASQKGRQPGSNAMDGLLQDLRFALRVWREVRFSLRSRWVRDPRHRRHDRGLQRGLRRAVPARRRSPRPIG